MPPLPVTAARDLIRRRHPEYVEHRYRWRQILDSLEGGERYRTAQYGTDINGRPVFNLIRHKREDPEPTKPGIAAGETPIETIRELRRQGMDSNAYGGSDDEFLRRLAITPPPRLLKQAVSKHVGRIYAQEVHRKGPDEVEAWWDDVDGRGTSIDDWLLEQVAEPFLALGQVDILIDRPPAPPGVRVRSKADSDRLGLGRPVAGVIRPDRLIWWATDWRGEYTEALVAETDPERGDLFDEGRRYRHWRTDGWTLYDGGGKALDSRPYPYGRPPIVRVFDRRKGRCAHVGQSDYEGVLDKERAAYNIDSEILLTNSQQACPILELPEQALDGSGNVRVGPGWALIRPEGAEGKESAGARYVAPPTNPVEFLRTTKADYRDEVDAETCQTKPAGAAGAGGQTTVAQSGISKAFDHRDGNDLLARKAKSLARLERRMALLALMVARGTPMDPAWDSDLTITYPGGFNLMSADEVAAFGAEFQAFLAAVGELPEVEGELAKRMIRAGLPGASDEQYALWEAEVDEMVARKAREKEQAAEMAAAGLAGAAAADGTTTTTTPGEGPDTTEGAADSAA